MSEQTTLKDEIERWLAQQMPIIQMHGGTSAVRKADPDDGEVIVELGGTCENCGISSRTAQNIKLDLAKEFDAINEVTVRVAEDGSSGWELEQPESFMGIDRNEGGRGGRGEGGPDSDDESHF
ncbi:MAG: NifU family protein [Halobacteriaceae archaeon]